MGKRSTLLDRLADHNVVGPKDSPSRISRSSRRRTRSTTHESVRRPLAWTSEKDDKGTTNGSAANNGSSANNGSATNGSATNHGSNAATEDDAQGYAGTVGKGRTLHPDVLLHDHVNLVVLPPIAVLVGSPSRHDCELRGLCFVACRHRLAVTVTTPATGQVHRQRVEHRTARSRHVGSDPWVDSILPCPFRPPSLAPSLAPSSLPPSLRPQAMLGLKDNAWWRGVDASYGYNGWAYAAFVAMQLYIVADFFWVLFVPTAVPALPVMMVVRRHAQAPHS